MSQLLSALQLPCQCAHAPSVLRSAMPAETDVLKHFECVGCGQLAAPPAVLSCGHVVCAREEGWSACPQPGCGTYTPYTATIVAATCNHIALSPLLTDDLCDRHDVCMLLVRGIAVGGRQPGAVVACGLADSILRTESPSVYEAALARNPRCSAAPAPVPSAVEAARTGARPPMNHAELVGRIVLLHSLSSAAGQLLNGLQGQIVSWDADSERFEVKLEVEGAASRTVRVRTANLRIPMEELLAANAEGSAADSPASSAASDQASAGAQEGAADSASTATYVHFGRGCDGCGVYPMVGRCFNCSDCDEAIGFDLCGSCFDQGLHRRADAVGRFNQAHRPEHQMVDLPMEDTFLHGTQP